MVNFGHFKEQERKTKNHGKIREKQEKESKKKKKKRLENQAFAEICSSLEGFSDYKG